MLDDLLDDAARLGSALRLGEVIAGKFRLERLLGRGGVAVVVEARHLQLDTRVAIKFLRPGALEHRSATPRFLQEARVVASMRSDHVARILDVGTLDSGYPYVVMEYLSGTDLERLVADRGRLPLEESVGYIIQVCEALAEAHARGVIHRDLKPANIFVTKHVDGSPLVKVLDFGLAKRRTRRLDGPDGPLTTNATVVGSPPYMSPEQVKNAPHVDSPTDIWSLGVILYELLSGERPFKGDNIFDLFANILGDRAQLMSERGASVPPKLDVLVHRCLEPDPALRPDLSFLARELAPFAPPSAKLLVERIRSVRRKGVVAYSGDTVPSLEPRTKADVESGEASSISREVTMERSGTAWSRAQESTDPEVTQDRSEDADAAASRPSRGPGEARTDPDPLGGAARSSGTPPRPRQDPAGDKASPRGREDLRSGEERDPAASEKDVVFASAAEAASPVVAPDKSVDPGAAASSEDLEEQTDPATPVAPVSSLEASPVDDGPAARAFEFAPTRQESLRLPWWRHRRLVLGSGLLGAGLLAALLLARLASAPSPGATPDRGGQAPTDGGVVLMPPAAPVGAPPPGGAARGQLSPDGSAAARPLSTARAAPASRAGAMGPSPATASRGAAEPATPPGVGRPASDPPQAAAREPTGASASPDRSREKTRSARDRRPKRRSPRPARTRRPAGARAGAAPSRTGARAGATPARSGARANATPARSGARAGATPARTGLRPTAKPPQAGPRKEEKAPRAPSDPFNRRW